MKLMITLIVSGVLLMIYGCGLRSVSAEASDDATSITLDKLEKEGFQGDNRHIKITQDHFLLFDIMAFKDTKQNPFEVEAEVFPYPGHTYTPIVAADHSIIEKIAAAYKAKELDVPFHTKKLEKKGSVWMRFQIERYDIRYPELKNFRVLIKDVRYKSTNEVPVFMKRANAIKGMVLEADSFSDRDREYVEKRYPGLDIDNHLIIVETGRRPHKGSFYNTLIYLGLASLLFGSFHGIKIITPKKTSGAFDNEDELTKYAKDRNPHLFR
jgi:hypothetical protein